MSLKKELIQTTLYIHVDRSGRLPIGTTIELTPCGGESRIKNFASMFADGFAQHIESLCKEGLSNHGLTYLVHFLRRETRYPLVFAELFLEFVRWKHNINVASRFQSFLVKQENIRNMPDTNDKLFKIYQSAAKKCNLNIEEW